MTNAQGVKALATAALLLAAMTACSDGKDSSATGTPSPTSPAGTTASSSPTPPTDSELASEAASNLVTKYYAVRDALRQNPTTPLARLTTVAIGPELNAQRVLFKRERADGWHQTGDTRIAELNVDAVDLTNTDPKAGRLPTAQVDVCYDVSAVDVLDAEGKSVITKDRPDTGWIRYSVANYNYAKDPVGSWRVVSGQNLERTPCDAS